MSDVQAGQGPDDEIEGFVAKWRARWPEWPLAEVFLDREQRPVALAWAALQQELLDAAWVGSDARPGELKLAWWVDELQGWAHGRRRHPLGRVLQREAAPWSALAAALPALARSRERPLDVDDAFEALRPAAAAAAAVENALFGVSGAGTHAAGGRLVAATWLVARVRSGDDAGVPLALLAPGGEQRDGRARWQSTLHAQWPDHDAGAPRARRLWAALARSRLASRDPDAAPSAPRALWGAWRAARN